MEEQVNQMQHPVLKIEQAHGQSGQYGTPVLNAGVSGVNQVYYVVMPNIPDQSNVITSAGTNPLMQNPGSYYVINTGNTNWNQLPVIHTSAAGYSEQEIPQISIPETMQTINYGTLNASDMIQGINDFATEVVINTEPEPEASDQKATLVKPSRECDVCHKILCNKDSLRRHKKLVHGNDTSGHSDWPEGTHTPKNPKQCECVFCGKVLCNKDSLRRHQKVVHKWNGKETVQTEPPLIKLEPLHPRGSSEQLMDESVRRLGEIQQHAQQMYYTQNATQEVPQPLNTAVQKPVKRIQKTKRKKHPMCEVCRKPFYNKATLLRHWSTFHKGMTMGAIQTTSVETNSTISCNICHRTFFDMPTLRRHKVVVHHDNSSMNSNPNSSMNGKSSPCHICGKVLYDKGVLRRHLKMVHKIDGDDGVPGNRKYAGTSSKSKKCNFCNKVLYDKGCLRRHLKSIHGIDNSDPLFSDSKVPFPEQSGSTTSTSSYTFVRSTVEIGGPPPVIPGLDSPVIETSKSDKNSPHACEKCEETFANASNLKRHLVIVHKMQIENYEAVLRQHTIHSKMPRSCNICGKTIIGRSNLVRHQQNVHKIAIKSEPKDDLNSVQNENNQALEQNYMMKCDPEETEQYPQEHMGHNGASHIETETEITTEQILPDNDHQMELDGKAVIDGIVNEVVFDLNEVEECTAKVKQEGEVDSNHSNDSTTDTNTN